MCDMSGCEHPPRDCIAQEPKCRLQVKGVPGIIIRDSYLVLWAGARVAIMEANNIAVG